VRFMCVTSDRLVESKSKEAEEATRQRNDSLAEIRVRVWAPHMHDMSSDHPRR
jgi:hypothetical protein